MHKDSKRQRSFASLLMYALLPFTILSLTYFVLAKEPDLFIEEESGRYSDVQITPEEFDISSEFYYEIEGTASYYGRKFHNRRAASGERYNMNEFTAAHRTLPFGTIVRITNLKTNKITLVRINDRGPFIKNRIIDLSHRSAKEINGLGLPKVKMETLLHPSELKDTLDATPDYFFGYSFDKPLVCLPKPVINIIDSTNQFEVALTKYQFHLVSKPDKDIYIFVPSEYTFRPESSKSEIRYYIATLRSNIKFRDYEDVASLQ